MTPLRRGLVAAFAVLSITAVAAPAANAASFDRVQSFRGDVWCC